eukprot:GHVS01076314.1.p1 GENE.GHVS01076314.1~~GHVS01076314.1.p1  ORF type:complete len:108 (-),score=9.87 GHVS01076314.1:395-718(-)
MALARGRCKWFNSQKGFGFIQLDNGEEVFVHQSEIYATGFRSLAEGEQIECEVITDDTGKKKAIKVTGPNGSTVQGESRRPYGDMFRMLVRAVGINNCGGACCVQFG